MSAKVSPSQQNPSIGHVRMIQSRSSNTSQNDDSGSGGSVAEGPARRRLHKPSSSSLSSEFSIGSAAVTNGGKAIAGPRPNVVSKRRQSIRDQKVPQGPRPQESSRRSNPSGSFLHSVNSSIDSTADSTTSSNSRFSHRSTSVENLSKRLPSRTPENNEFLAPINFDDFHNSIMAEPSLSHFPMPGTSGSGSDAQAPTFHPTNPWAARTGGSGQAYTSSTGLRTASGRRQSEVPRPIDQSSDAHPATGPSSGSSARSRRQSLAQTTNSNGTTARPPRKSIGPGTVPFSTPATAPPRRRPSLTARNVSQDMTSSSSLPTNRAQNLDAAGTEETKLPSNARSFKAKSLQPPSRKPRETFLGPAGGADHARSASIIAVQTAAKCPPAETAAPGSASKRISVMPPHATGLGARTISPTDARRMKRLSMAPTAPPLPSAATQAQTEPVPVRPRSTAQSPSYIPVKSATPSSNRTTPDPNRKSYSSGQSVSSNTSYNSVRSSGSSLQPRLPANVSTSRLPTPKPRVENLTNSTEEEVPPVPAIPKVYESPKSELDPPIFYTPRKSSLPIDMELLRLKRNSDAEADTGPGDGGGERASQSSEAEIDLRTPQASARKNTAVTANTGISKKNLQPLKLPPLNLLPLSTPMTTKIEALKDRKSDELKSWTPQNQIIPKTPSTPMTASKANFWAAEDDEDPTFLTQARSSTAHFAVSTSMALRTASSSSALSTFELPSKSRAISPYTSYTLPKSTSEYNHLRQKPSGDYSHKGLQPSHFSGARPQTQSSALSFTTETFSQQSTPSDPEANSISGASLRQVTTNPVRHGSIAKGQTTSEADPVSAKNETMPPPKLPASATWNSLSSFKSANPAGKPAYFHSRRQSSLSSVPTTVARKPSFSSEASLALESTASHESGGSDGAQRATSTILSPMQKILSSARASASAKARPIDPKIDPDEYVADEEMKRLASKRKEFEVAARNLDELRRRAGPKERVSPAQALKMASLNIFERGEIIDFKDIYFCGTQTAKKHVGDLHSSSANFGYDDERGDYNIVIGDHLAYRYEVVDLLGKGSFGQVVRCIDHKTGVLVAVKIIRNKKRFHQQALVEVNILQKLKEWDPHGRHSVVNFTQSFYFRGHLCVSTELLGINLYEFIKAHDFKGFALKLIRRFTKQMLGTLVLLHSKKVIHCDLKPENILLVHPLSSEIKVIDFGSSCFEHEKVYTYIQSRFYRSPEVILGMSYGMPIDMWSLGCILAELYTGYPIFPGENEQEQLACIMEIFGPPEKHLIEKSTRRKLFFDSLGKPRLTVSSKGRRRRPSSKDLRQVLKCDDEAFLDFIARCLRWDPARRLNPLDAMKHEFITGVKMTPRSRSYNLGVNSPAKRPNVTGTPSTRPLPEPPGTALKNGTFVRSHDVSGNSPSKANVLSKRSTVSGMPPSTPAKRASNNTLSGTSLPRVATRSISGKPDLATAAAATSLVRPRPQAPASRTLI